MRSWFYFLGWIIYAFVGPFRPEEAEMSVTEPSKKAALPQIVKLDKALKLVRALLLCPSCLV